MLYAPFQSYAVVMATTTLTIVSNAGTFFQSYVYCIAILLLILHDLYLLFSVLFGAKLAAILWLLAVRTTFFVCTNYLTVVYCNQPCIVFIYILYIFCCWVEKEPLPQSVEVLSHAAARAATFFNCIAALPASHIPQHFTAGKLSILCSHADCFYAKVFTLSSPTGLFQSYAVTWTVLRWVDSWC